MDYFIVGIPDQQLESGLISQFHVSDNLQHAASDKTIGAVDSGVITAGNVEDHVVQEPSVSGRSVAGDGGKLNINCRMYIITTF